MLRTSRLLSTTTQRIKPAVALDIDGVLIRGGMVLPSTKRALKKLAGDNQDPIPFIFLTNGGGCTELAKAQQLSQMFDIDVKEHQVVLAHSPMKLLAQKQQHLRDGLCLIIGPDQCKEVALKYGFKRPVLPSEIMTWNPSIWPFKKPSTQPPDVLYHRNNMLYFD